MLSPADQTVHSDPEIMGGTPVFVGTRVPFQTLLDYLEGGEPLAVFLDDFPTVSREQAVLPDAEVLKFSGHPRLVEMASKGLAVHKDLAGRQDASGQRHRRGVQQHQIDGIRAEVQRRDARGLQLHGVRILVR